jgi:hypothetical protein
LTQDVTWGVRSRSSAGSGGKSENSYAALLLLLCMLLCMLLLAHPEGAGESAFVAGSIALTSIDFVEKRLLFPFSCLLSLVSCLLSSVSAI